MFDAQKNDLANAQLKLDENFDALLESVFLDEDKTVDPKILDVLFNGNTQLIKRLESFNI